MNARAVNAYQVASESDPEEYHQVVIDPAKTPATSCDCEAYVLRNEVCEHIERAMTCYFYGL